MLFRRVGGKGGDDQCSACTVKWLEFSRLRPASNPCGQHIPRSKVIEITASHTCVLVTPFPVRTALASQESKEERSETSQYKTLHFKETSHLCLSARIESSP